MSKIVDNVLHCSNAGVDTAVDLDDILCVVTNPSGYSVLFFHQDLERVYLKKLEITSLPTELVPFETTIPPHLRDATVHVVISTGSGIGKAKTIYQDTVLPFLTYLGIDHFAHETEDTQTVSHLARTQFLEQANQGIPQTIILLSGDGGLVDILDVFYRSNRTVKLAPSLALIPCGTGNAMASSIGLRSGSLPGLSTLLHGNPSSVPVFAAKFSTGSRLVADEGRLLVPIDQDNESVPHTLWGAVVASWGLHAALVADSDTAEYRRFGVDRFKMAANELLYPSDGTPCHAFKGQISIVTSEDPTKAQQLEELEHMYALATLVPRLEKEFLISPNSEPLGGQMKFIRFGPMAPEDAMRLMSLAYQGGQHVQESTVTYADVETLRIDFQEEDEKWRRICIDGKIVVVQRDGWVELRKEPSRLLNLKLPILAWLSLSWNRADSMLITARTYSASQTPDQGATPSTERTSRYHTLAGWRKDPIDARQAADMLLIHQVGSVRVGEVVRYTITYTPAADPILPIPADLYVRVRNTSAIPLRAAYLHGPYTLYAACYPAQYDPNTKFEKQGIEGTPQYEPYLKAGGGWDATIKIPSHLLEAHEFGSSGQGGPTSGQSVTWIVEIQSQVIFSTSAAVHFELLVSRDEKSLAYFSGGAWSSGSGPPGKLLDHWEPNTKGKQVLASKGVYSKAITAHVDDTNSLWNSPSFPSVEEASNMTEPGGVDSQPVAENSKPTENPDTSSKRVKKKKVHLVLLTHGLHSNLGADMLFLKESIDAAARNPHKNAHHTKTPHVDPIGPENPSSADSNQNIQVDSDSDDEEVIVRGFSGNAVRTERGIQYLGKRLAKYVLLLTYPDQPYFPLKGPKPNPFSRPFSARKDRPQPSSTASTQENQADTDDHAYQITSISFIGHSLGGLVQTYAIAYIQKHSPQFFDQIKPVNFIAMATPFLGLSNENPMYVRFALDLGLVGRTGQDLGLSWTAPKVRNGWGAMIAGRGDAAKDPSHPEPGSKPLLRILPCGPAHKVLSKFQHRTVYSNVVNDGIVPLRTSCLLFLDWRGLDRVEKARRDNGLVGTMAEWGWAELTGANSKSPRFARSGEESPLSLSTSNVGFQDTRSLGVATSPNGNQGDKSPLSPKPGQFLAQRQHSTSQRGPGPPNGASENTPLGPIDSFLSMFRPKEKKSLGSKQSKIYNRSQTLGALDSDVDHTPPVAHSQHEQGVHTPPKTTFFESAGDLLMPPLPPPEFILDPAARPRTIFHDRVYHPEDIPNPLPVKRRTLNFGSLQGKQSKSAPTSATQHSSDGSNTNVESGLKIEEKIARAYHRDLSWRKVLVRLEPDAHNNIIVRRMFTNAYGWPVVKHLVDTHFGHAPLVDVDDSMKQNVDRAKSPGVGPTSSGDEVEGQSGSEPGPQLIRSNTDILSSVSGLYVSEDVSDDGASAGMDSPRTLSASERGQYSEVSRQDSARWTDREIDEDDDCESGLEDSNVGFRWSRHK
ncbi:unnamed protein product [Penicillium salamii]|uniref:DAGKc domain-containing protein n=1 Tax=Penicillium salamii TaxID=1612424 RepID=A0A9W4JHK0_9EURO|nr:unnamed protein product [Penicillium salamii]